MKIVSRLKVRGAIKALNLIMGDFAMAQVEDNIVYVPFTN